jgi:holo-[acyl-carrier protein] synthase
MIIGLGSDLCDIRRIEKTLERFGDRFVARVFTTVEQRKAESLAHSAATYAKRFAAKEACAKALGTGFSRGVFLKDIGVVNGPSGAPTLALTGGAAKRLASILPNDHEAHIHLTLTDEPPLAMAVVVIEALPRRSRTP